LTPRGLGSGDWDQGAGPARPSGSDCYTDHMTRQMTATEFKAKVLSLLDQVAGGDEIEITKHGRTVARLIGARGARAARGRLAGRSRSQADDEGLFSTGALWDLP